MKSAATSNGNVTTLLAMEANQSKEIGERLAFARHRAGYTQEQLGDLIGRSARSIQDYESGKTIPWKEMRQIALVTELPVDWLIHGSRDTFNVQDALGEILARLERIERRLGGEGHNQSSGEGGRSSEHQ